jgi:hypothetical protein
MIIYWIFPLQIHGQSGIGEELEIQAAEALQPQKEMKKEYNQSMVFITFLSLTPLLFLLRCPKNDQGAEGCGLRRAA